MNPPSLPDVLFLRPKKEKSANADTSAPVMEAPHHRPADVIFAADNHSTAPANHTVPTPHTRFKDEETRFREIMERETAIEPALKESAAGKKPTGHRPTPTVEAAINPVAEIDAPPAPPVSTQPTDAKTASTAKEHSVETEPTTIIPSWMVETFRWNPITEQIIRYNRPAFKRLIHQLQATPPAELGTARVIAVAGLGKRLGTTTLAQLLTQLLDRSERAGPRVPFAKPLRPSLLLDAGLWNPGIGQQVGLRCRRCWADIKETEQTLSEALIANSANEIHVMPLNCALQSDELDDSHCDYKALSYTIPASGIDGLLGRLESVLNKTRAGYENIILDVGDIDPWMSHQLGKRLARQATHLLLVNRDPVDRRTFSHVYWEMADAGLSNVHLIENPELKRTTVGKID